MKPLALARYLLLAALSVAVLTLIACRDDGRPEPAPTPSPGATATATASATPSPTSTALPTATPTVPATATATPTSTPTPRPTPTPASGPGVRIDHGLRSSGAVALTFDMGGRVDPALDIMNWLVANQVKATIFMTGAMAENPNTDAGRQVLAIVAANPGLFELGNHSYSHPDFRTLTAAGMRDELARTEAAVANYTGVSLRPLFRPPFGGVNADVLAGVGPAGYPYTIMWDVDTIDWRPEEDGGPTAAAIVAKVVANAQGGSIVLMHLGGYNTYEALPAIVAGLRERGLGFAKVSEVLP